MAKPRAAAPAARKGTPVDPLPARIAAIERPHPNLMTLYVVRSLLALPVLPIILPYLFFRYHSMRFRFDEQGIRMSWGILFRREVNLTYARIQDIHLHSGLVQRWLRLADIQVQTAAGSALPEMILEGLLEYEDVRDFLYSRMRGHRDGAGSRPASVPSADVGDVGDVGLLREIAAELRGARQALEAAAPR